MLLLLADAFVIPGHDGVAEVLSIMLRVFGFRQMALLLSV